MSARWRDTWSTEKWDNTNYGGFQWLPPHWSTVSCFVCVHFWERVIETQLVVDKDVVVRVDGGYFQDGILSVSCVQSQLSLFACNPAEIFTNKERRGSRLWTCFCLNEGRRTFNLVNAEQPQRGYTCLEVSTQGSFNKWPQGCSSLCAVLLHQNCVIGFVFLPSILHNLT